MNDTKALSPEEEAKNIFDILRQRKLTLSTAESCTGGNIAHHITLIPGSSEVFMGGIVSYSNDIKHRLLGVGDDTLSIYGAVSREVVEQMAEGASRVCLTDCAVATSGIAGPTGAVPGKPVGTVWIAARCCGITESRLFHFSGNRTEIINQATAGALSLLHTLLLK